MGRGVSDFREGPLRGSISCQGTTTMQLSQSLLTVPPAFQPRSHQYRSHRGPWIESYFYRYFQQHRPTLPRTYVPIFWTDIYFHNKFQPSQEIIIFLENELRPEATYFTIVQFDDGILEPLTENILVFGAGGV